MPRLSVGCALPWLRIGPWSSALGCLSPVTLVSSVFYENRFVTPVDQFWIIDYRIYDPAGDGKTKLDHLRDMLLNCVYQKNLELWAVWMDTWYATQEIMLQIEKLGKIYYCPLKDNRQVDDSGGTKPYQRMDGLDWTEAEKQHGKIIKVKGFPADHKVKVFRVVLSTQRTDYIVTNEMAQDHVEVVQDVCGFCF